MVQIQSDFTRKIYTTNATAKNVFWGICFHSLWSDDNENTDISSIVNHQIYMGISRNHNKLHNIELLSLGSLCMRKWSNIIYKEDRQCAAIHLG